MAAPPSAQLLLEVGSSRLRLCIRTRKVYIVLLTDCALTRTMESSRSSSPGSSRPTTVTNRDQTLPRRPWRWYTTSFDEISSHNYKGSGTDSDPYVVDWLRGDMEDPQNWPKTYKWTQIFLISFLTLCVALSSSAYAGAVRSLMQQFGGETIMWTAGVCMFHHEAR